MGGQMPDVCPRCRAFLVSGRPDCPFCGAEAAAAEAAARAAAAQGNGPAGTPPAPDSWLPPTPAALQAAGPRGGGNSTLQVVGGIAAAVVLLAGLFLWGPDLGSKGGTGEAADAPDAVPALLASCREAKPIADAMPFKPTPGRHRLEGMVLWKDGISLADPPERLQLEQGWNSPESDGDVRLDELQLVACYTATSATVSETCQMRENGGGRVVDLDIVKTTGTLVIREARTGKEVLRKHIGVPDPITCDEVWFAKDTKWVQHPGEAISSLLRLYNDGTEPGLPVREQARQVCEEELDRAVLRAEKPLDAVAVFTRPAKEMPFEPLTKDSKYVLPSELNVVPPEDAGTVLCITSYPAEGTYGVATTGATARTLATGETGQGASFDAEELVVDDQDRTVLPWTDADGGLQAALTSPRTLDR